MHQQKIKLTQTRNSFSFFMHNYVKQLFPVYFNYFPNFIIVSYKRKRVAQAINHPKHKKKVPIFNIQGRLFK